MKTNTLIALVDGSAYSESVCHYAGWIARRLGAKVKIYHVMGRRMAAEPQDLSGAIRLGARSSLLAQLSEMDAARAKLAQEHGRALLEDAGRIVAGDGDVEVATRLRQGDLIETVAAKEATGDLIVIGKRGEAANFAAGHPGSNLERVARSSKLPVFVASRAFRPVARALIAFDGGAASRRAAAFVAESPLFAGLPVALVHAGEESAPLRDAMEEARAAIAASGREAEAIFRPGPPEIALCALTEAEGRDLLVMGASGRSRMRSLFIGSTSMEMMRSCRTPVLLIR